MTGRRTVPLLDLRRRGAAVDGEMRAAFERVLTSGHYILGPEVDALERECAQALGVRHALGVSSGTDALILALTALGIGPGDDVLCPTYTFFAAAGSIARLGARPIFIDIEDDSFHCSAATVRDRLTPATRAVIPVHLFGQAMELGPLLELAAARGLHLIEDAAQAWGAVRDGRRAGTRGAFGCFSFFPSKNLGALGDAGLLVTDDDRLADQARLLRTHGSRPKYHHAVIGGNFRIDALQAALLRVNLAHVVSFTDERRQNARHYTEALLAAGIAAASRAGGKPLIVPAIDSGHGCNQYVVRVVGQGVRDRLRAFLQQEGVATEVYYPVPMHLQPCFAALGHHAGDLPAAERAAGEALALPVFPGLEPAEIEYVVDRLGAFFSGEPRTPPARPAL